MACCVPRLVCGLGANGFFEGALSAQLPLADRVASHVSHGVRPEDLHTGSEHFDGEWALVTNQMAVLGMGQLILQHPEDPSLRERFLPAMRRAVEEMSKPGARAFGTKQWGVDGLAALSRDEGHVYLGYFAMALGMLRLVDPEFTEAQRRLHDALIEAFERRLSRASHGLIETFPGTTFPADVSSAIGAIGLHARATGVSKKAFLAKWRAAFERSSIDGESGYLFQTVDPESGRATGPARGSGTAIAVYFLSFADRDLASKLDDALRCQGHRSFMGFGGVAEYGSEEASGGGDIDSGPVVFGVSVSATGFGMAGPRMFGDEERFVSYFRTADLFGARVPSRSGYLVGTGLGDAVLFAMMTAERSR